MDAPGSFGEHPRQARLLVRAEIIERAVKDVRLLAGIRQTVPFEECLRACQTGESGQPEEQCCAAWVDPREQRYHRVVVDLAFEQQVARGQLAPLRQVAQDV